MQHRKGRILTEICGNTELQQHVIWMVSIKSYILKPEGTIMVTCSHLLHDDKGPLNSSNAGIKESAWHCFSKMVSNYYNIFLSYSLTPKLLFFI